MKLINKQLINFKRIIVNKEPLSYLCVNNDNIKEFYLQISQCHLSNKFPSLNINDNNRFITITTDFDISFEDNEVSNTSLGMIKDLIKTVNELQLNTIALYLSQIGNAKSDLINLIATQNLGLDKKEYHLDFSLEINDNLDGKQICRHDKRYVLNSTTDTFACKFGNYLLNRLYDLMALTNLK